MKIDCEVIGAETRGDLLRVSLQGKAVADAAWRPFAACHFEVTPTKSNARAFYVGRRVEIEVSPK